MKLKRYGELNEADDIFDEMYSDEIEENEIEQHIPDSKKRAFSNHLTSELTNICDRVMKFLDPEDIEQILIELSHKYGDMK